MYLLESWLYVIPQLLPVLGLAVAFGFVAWGLRAVTIGAAVTGTLLTAVLCAAAGPRAFLPILAVFLLAFLTTRAGRRKKERLGTSERKGGRNARQILANVGIAVLCAAPLLFIHHASHILLLGSTAALAEAAADTVSSELGQAFGGRPWLITSFRRVLPGEDGGFTIFGTVSALLASVIVCLTCSWAGMLVQRFFWIGIFSGFIGMLVDSLLGATLERKGLLGNDAVNFSSTACAAAIAILWAFLPIVLA